MQASCGCQATSAGKTPARSQRGTSQMGFPALSALARRLPTSAARVPSPDRPWSWLITRISGPSRRQTAISRALPWQASSRAARSRRWIAPGVLGRVVSVNHGTNVRWPRTAPRLFRLSKVPLPAVREPDTVRHGGKRGKDSGRKATNLSKQMLVVQ